MFRHLLLGLLVAAPAAARAADPPLPADVQDFLFLAPDRPLLLRLHLLVEGKPAAERWTAYVDRLFAFFDRDGDGYLDKEEAGRIFTPAQMQQLFAESFAFVQGQAPPPLSRLDLNEDGKLSKAESSPTAGSSTPVLPPSSPASTKPSPNPSAQRCSPPSTPTTTASCRPPS
jgi:hypothetical protein